MSFYYQSFDWVTANFISFIERKQKQIKITIYFYSPSLRDKTIKILSIRLKKSVSLETSVLFTIKLPANDVDLNNAKWIGWEPNDQGKYIPKVSQFIRYLLSKFWNLMLYCRSCCFQLQTKNQFTHSLDIHLHWMKSN